MQPTVMGAIGATMVLGGALAIIWSRRTEVRRGRPDTLFRYAWSAVIIWFGALPIAAAIVDGAHLSSKLRDVACALALVTGLSAAVSFVGAGMRARRAEFRELQREFLDNGPHAAAVLLDSLWDFRMDPRIQSSPSFR